MSGFSDISNNSGPGSAAEPSMEEILASIRRILKEDESGRTTAKADDRLDIDDDVLVLDSSMVAKSPALDSATMLMPEPALEHELAENHGGPAGTDDHHELHITSESTLDAGTLGTPPVTALDEMAAPVEPAPEPVDELILPEPTQPALAETPAPEMPAPVAETIDPEPAETVAAAAPEPDPEPEPEPEPAPEPVAEPTTKKPVPEPAREPYMSEQIQPPEGLLGVAAIDSAKNSIGSLVRSISAERAVAVSRVGVTIEDIVREEIRPMLKAWLDTHLPVLVERIVRAEIERVVDRTQL
jgi:cell pole-organizing protein PopZ